jgi:hypothetical protein
MYLVERYHARRFHGTVYFLNQLSSDLDRWEALPEHVSNLASIATLAEMRYYSSKQRRHWNSWTFINTFKKVILLPLLLVLPKKFRVKYLVTKYISSFNWYAWYLQEKTEVAYEVDNYIFKEIFSLGSL